MGCVMDENLVQNDGNNRRQEDSAEYLERPINKNPDNVYDVKVERSFFVSSSLVNEKMTLRPQKHEDAAR